MSLGFPKTEERLQYLNEYVNAKDKDRVKFFYEHLSVIDSKASVLLRFDSLLLAILTVLVFASKPGTSMTAAHVATRLEQLMVVMGWIAVLTLMVSMILSLTVVWLHWFTLNDITKLNNEPPDPTVLTEKFNLVGVRTSRYQLSWIFALLAGIQVPLLLLYRLYRS
jgi:hypothetical protein